MTLLLELLLTGFLAVHLLSVNVGMAAPLVCIWLHSRAGKRQDALADRVGLRLARGSVFLTAVGLLSGGVLLAILWLQGEQSYFDAMHQFTESKYWFALGELAFYAICMVPYIRLWKRCQATRKSRILHASLAVLAATNLLYHFPPMMAVLATIPTRPEWMGVTIDAAKFREMLVDPEITARVFHVWLSSFAVTGVVLMAMSLREARDNDKDQASRLAMVGARLALAPTLLQILIGVWVLLTIPTAAQSALMGGDLLGTALLAGSVLLALGLMHLLASVALGDVNRKAIVRVMILLTLLVVLMSGVLRRVRTASRQVSHSSQVASHDHKNSRADCSTRLEGHCLL